MDVNLWLRRGLIAGIFLIPFIPLMVSGAMYFPFITGKNFFFRIVIEIMAVGWILLALRDAAYRPRASGILWALGAFVGVITLAALVGENIERSFWSNFERMEGVVTHLHFFLYFLIASSMLTTRRLWNRLFQTSLGVSVLVGFYGLLQLGGAIMIHQGGVRLDATFGNATYLAIYAVFHAFIALMFIAREGMSRGMRVIYALIFLLNLIMLYQTATRGAILGFIGGIGLTMLLIAFLDRAHRHLRKIAVGVIVALVVFVGAFYALRDTSFIQEAPVLKRFANISLEDKTVQARFLIWDIAWQGFKERPILGWGPENFNLIFNTYYNPALFDQEPFFDRAHNVFLDWLTAGGLLGLLAYLSLFGLGIWTLWRSPVAVREKGIITGLLAAYFFHNLFVFDNVVSYILFISVLAYIHVRSKESEQRERGKEYPEYIQYVVMAFVAVGLVVSLYIVNIKPMLTARAIISGISNQEEGLQKNLEYLKRAIAYNTFGTPEAREQLVQVTNQLRSQGAGEQVLMPFFQLTRSEMEKQIAEVPQDVRYELFYGSFLNQFNFFDEAIAHLERAVELSPGKQQIRLELASVYINKGDTQKALEIVEDAFELEPRNREARDIYGVIAIYAGEYERAREVLVPPYEDIYVPENRFAIAFASNNDYASAVIVLERLLADMVEKGNNTSQIRVSLAASYTVLGRRTDAIEQIERAIEENPQLQQPGQQWIQAIRADQNPF